MIWHKHKCRWLSPDGVESGRCRFLVCRSSEGSNTDFTGESSPTSNSSWCRCFICPLAHTEQRRTCTCVDFCDLCTTGRLWQEGEACWRNLTCSKHPSLMSGVQRHHTLILCEVKISCKKKKVVTSSVQLSFSLCSEPEHRTAPELVLYHLQSCQIHRGFTSRKISTVLTQQQMPAGDVTLYEKRKLWWSWLCQVWTLACSHHFTSHWGSRMLNM